MSVTVAARAQLPDLYAGMNGIEKEWAIQLEAQKRTGKIADWRYEEITFILAHDLRYTPDFMVIESDGRIRFDETKGFWREDAKIKFRLARKQFPHFTFTAHRKLPKKSGGEWVQESF